MCAGVSVWLGWSGIRVAGWSTSSCASACITDTTPTQPHRISNTHRTKNETTNVVIQQHSRKLLMMDILMPETFWAHKKWNKIASDIKLVFYSSAITMMHGPINRRFPWRHWSFWCGIIWCLKISVKATCLVISRQLTFWRRFFFLILAHTVYKMWIIQEPNTLELWNKLHFEEKRTESIYHV
jgi:hypothetical protein